METMKCIGIYTYMMYIDVMYHKYTMQHTSVFLVQMKNERRNGVMVS